MVGRVMVKVLLFSQTLRGRGMERSVVRLLESLDRSRLRPVLALAEARGEFLPRIPKDVQVYDLNSRTRRPIWALTRLLQVVREVKPDCVVGVHTTASRMVCLLRLLHPGLKVIAWEGDPFAIVERTKGLYSVRKLATKLLFRLAHKLVAASEVVASDLERELRVRPERTRIIPHPCVDEELFALAEEAVVEPPFGTDLPIILNIGNMYPHKAQETLIAALGQVRAIRGAHLVIIGEGPRRQELEKFAASLGLSDYVHFLGFQPNPFKYLARSQVYASSATSEGFDIAQVEALACQVPVIVTDVPRFKAVRHGESGLLVPPNDPSAMAGAILRILEEPGLAQKLSIAGFQFAQSLTSEQVARTWEQLIYETAGV